jgi:hypothetical protein
MHRPPSVACVAILLAACGSSDPQSKGGPAGAAANNPHGTSAVEAGGSGGDDQGGGSDGAAQALDDGGLGVAPPPGDASGGGSVPSRDAAPLDGAPADAAPGPRTCKRGIAANAAPAAALAPSASAAGVSWWYNWASSGSGQAANIEFVPMIWGSSSIGNALPKGSTYVLGFNEPNFKSQSDLTPQQAAADWPMIETHAKAVGAKIVSPAVNYCGSASACSDPTVTDPYTYLKDFLAACTGCEVDYVAVHWYNCDLPSLQAYLEGNLDAGGGLQGFVQFGKPIWLTEFSCDGSHSVADQKAYMEAAVPYLEKNPHVFRYSWFSAGPIANAELANSDGSLTDLGKTYVGLPQNCP